MGDHELKQQKTLDVQDIWYQRQRILRTVLQTALAFLVGLGSSVGLLQAVAPQVLAAVIDVLPPAVYGWLVGVFAFVITLAGALSKLMAIPIVNAWLTRVGFGSVPKAVARESAAAKSQELQPAQFAPSDVDYRTEQVDPATGS